MESIAPTVEAAVPGAGPVSAPGGLAKRLSELQLLNSRDLRDRMASAVSEQSAEISAAIFSWSDRVPGSGAGPGWAAEDPQHGS